MAHQRQLIREAVKAALVDKTAAAARVYETQLVQWRRVQLPAIAVYSLSETIDPESAKSAPRELTRKLSLRIVAAVEAGDNVDDALDAIGLEVEKVMDADPFLGGTCFDSVLSSVELETDADGAKPIGGIVLTYAVTYHTDAPAAADVALPDDFATAGVTTDLSGTTDPGNQAQDVVAIPTT